MNSHGNGEMEQTDFSEEEGDSEKEIVLPSK